MYVDGFIITSIDAHSDVYLSVVVGASVVVSGPVVVVVGHANRFVVEVLVNSNNMDVGVVAHSVNEQ